MVPLDKDSRLRTRSRAWKALRYCTLNLVVVLLCRSSHLKYERPVEVNIVIVGRARPRTLDWKSDVDLGPTQPVPASDIKQTIPVPHTGLCEQSRFCKRAS